MRRLTIFLYDEEYRRLEKKSRETGPQHLANALVLNWLGVKVPKKREKWHDFFMDRRMGMLDEGYRADELGRGDRIIDMVAKAFEDTAEVLTAKELKEKLPMLSVANINRCLNSHPQHFDRVDDEKRKHMQAIKWRRVTPI